MRGSERDGEARGRTALAGALALLCLPCFMACPSSASQDHRKTLTVFAAASTADLFPKIARAFEQDHPDVTVRLSFGASSTLARQVLAGAPADVFVSANERWMDALEKAGRLRANTRLDVLANHLVIVGARASSWKIELRPGLDLARAAGGRVALGDPTHVPAGLYARRALEALGGWASLESRIIAAPNVRAALRMVEMGEAPAGIVYETDARASAKVRVVERIPDRLSGPIRYPAAAIAGGAEAGPAFVRFLLSSAARDAIREAGFSAAGPAPAEPHARGQGAP